MVLILIKILLIHIWFIEVSAFSDTVKSHLHSINKTIWIFSQNSQTSLFEKLNFLNIQHYAKMQNYSIQQVDEQNYSQHLSSSKKNKVQLAHKSMMRHFQNQNILKQDYNQSAIQINLQRLIIYALIAQNGGVFIDQSVTLVEPLDDFLDFSIQKSQFLNGGHRIYERSINYCLGFFNEQFSSQSQNFNFYDLKDGKKNFWLYKPHITLYPNLQDYFIACTKGNLFIQRLFENYVEILIKGKQWEHLSEFNSNQKLIGMTNPDLLFQQSHLIASHWTLQKSQSTFSQISPNLLAIRDLGYIAINSRLGPDKIKTLFYYDQTRIIPYISKLTIPQIQLFIGRLHSVFRFDLGVQKKIEQKIWSYETPTQFWVPNSFAHIFWIKHIYQLRDQQKFSQLWQIVSTFNIFNNSLNMERSLEYNKQNQINPVKKIRFNLSKPKWQSLDKNVWFIWDSGVEGKSNLIVQLCYENLKRSAENSGFKIHAVSQSTVHKYLSKQIIEKIEKAVQNASFDLSRQAFSDLWRMALIYENGGVYFDASTFSTDESLDWIVKIPQIQQNLIWNRYGQQPQVFMLWNALYGSPLDWKQDSENKTKSQWHLSYENNFIVASKGAELIEEWLDTMLEWIQLPYSDTQSQMSQVNIIKYKWTGYSKWNFQSGRYLTAMDSLKYIFGKRQIFLQRQTHIEQFSKFKNSAHYYKIWSMPGHFVGQQKLRGETNYEHLDYRLSGQQKSYNTIYKYKLPVEQVQQILGPISFQGKYFSRDLAFMNKIINDLYNENPNSFSMSQLYQHIHPKSLVAKFLFNTNPNKTQSLIKYYNVQSMLQRNFKSFSKIWIY